MDFDASVAPEDARLAIYFYLPQNVNNVQGSGLRATIGIELPAGLGIRESIVYS